MRAAVLYDVDDIRIEERPVPDLQPGDVLVQTGASGICSGDLVGWYVRRKAPFVFGHEPVGTVVALGPPLESARAQSGEDKRATLLGSEPVADGDSRPQKLDESKPLVIGDRIFAHHHAPCLKCAFCARHEFVQCRGWRESALDPGAMADYFRLPHANLVDALRLPDTLAFADASLLEPLACVVKALRRAVAVTPEELSFGLDAPRLLREEAFRDRNLYVIGLGPMGLLDVAVGRHLGARVFASDLREDRRERGRALGAQTFEPQQALVALRALDARGADIVICGPGTPAALQHALDAVAPGGTVVLFSPLESGAPFPLDAGDLYFRDLRLIGSYSCGPDDTREALRLLVAGVVRATDLGAELVRLEDLPGAYARMARAEILKVIAVWP
jgi:L-iditol 2-dehydrogenase